MLLLRATSEDLEYLCVPRTIGSSLVHLLGCYFILAHPTLSLTQTGERKLTLLAHMDYHLTVAHEQIYVPQVSRMVLSWGCLGGQNK